MKQKRKIKSLLPQRQKQQIYLMTTILLILSLVFCIGTAVLITSSVLAAPISQQGNPVNPIDIQVGPQDPGNLQMPGGDSLDPNGGSTHGKTQGGDSPENGDNNIVETVYKQFEYDGIDDNAEVVYGIRFVNPLNMSQIRNSIFIQDQSLNISPNPVVVNPAADNNIDRSINIVESGVYSHILGGTGNIVSASNVTMVAGAGNQISSGHDSVSILGGNSNIIREKGILKKQQQRTPHGNIIYTTYPSPTESLSIGGQGNEIGSANLGVGMIGGYGNKTSGRLLNSFILGGQNNTIIVCTGNQEYACHGLYRTFDNIIVGGQNNYIENLSHVFVYSNSDTTFTPQSSNAFYLNMEKGVGVNTTGEDKGLFVNGGAYIGEVDIARQCRSESDYGIIGSYSGCLVGCTKVSSDGYTYKRSGATVRADYVWEMLDLGENCKKICEDNPEFCISSVETENTAEEVNRIYTDAQCTNNVNTGYATICSKDSNFTGGYKEFYKNVIFETTLLDSDTPCPEGWENQCVYRCNSGYHLTGSAENGTIRCYKDCELPWNKTIKKKHGDTITAAYNITEVSCSNDIYVFPLKTELIGMGKPLYNYSIGSIVKNGVTYKNRVRGGMAPESCATHDHEKTLICQEGEWYLMDDKGKAIQNSTGLAQNYKYESCNVNGYACDSLVLKTDPCIKTDDIYNCIINEGCNKKVYDLNKDKQINTADVAAVYAAAKENKCYTKNGDLQMNSCITANYVYDRIIYGISKYDVNRDGKLDTADVNAIYDAAKENKCYGYSLPQEDPCIRADDIYKCIIDAGCKRTGLMLYDVNRDGKLDTADVNAVNSASKERECYRKTNRNKIDDKCITADDVYAAIANGMGKMNYDVNGDGMRNTADVNAVYNAAMENKCYMNEYNYTADTISSQLQDNIIVTGVDRSPLGSIGTRGRYTACHIYEAGVNGVSNTYLTNYVCTQSGNRFKFDACQNGYDPINGACKKQCRLGGNPYKHGDVIIGYKSATETCTDTCQGATLVCNDGTWNYKARLETNPCITADDIYNCIETGGCDRNIHDIDGDSGLNTADVVAVYNAAKDNQCYMKVGEKIDNPCITENDIYNCIINGGCGNNYDVNEDGKINTADITAINTATNNNECYQKGSKQTRENPCITDKNIYDCINNGICGKAYDINGDSWLNKADVTAIYNAAKDNQCYTQKRNLDSNPCITADDIYDCINNGNCGRGGVYDVNGDGSVDTADVVAVNNALAEHKCYIKGTNGGTNINVGEYSHDRCTLEKNKCDGYDISFDDYLSLEEKHGEYEKCESYEPIDNFACRLADIKYKISKCATGYHKDGIKCVPNVKTGYCTRWDGDNGHWNNENGSVSDYPRFKEFGVIYLDQGQYITVWTGEWDNGHWTGTYPANACEWECDRRYHKNGNKCDPNKCSGGDAPGNITAGMIKFTSQPLEDKQKWSYYTGAYITGYVGECQWGCNDGYHRNGNKCEPNECHYCANNGFPYCFPMDFRDECKENAEYYKN